MPTPAQREKLRGSVILQLFSQLIEYLLCSFVTRKNPKLRVSERVKACLHTKRTKAVSRSKAPAQRFAIQTKLCVPVALFSPLLSLRGKFGNGATRSPCTPCNAAFQRSNIHYVQTQRHSLCAQASFHTLICTSFHFVQPRLHSA